MKKVTAAQIDFLLHKKHFGKLTAEESFELAELLTAHPEGQLLEDQIITSISEGMHTYVQGEEEAMAAAAEFQDYREQGKLRKIGKRRALALAAACIAVAAGSVVVWRLVAEEKGAKGQELAQLDGQKVRFTLPSGKVFTVGEATLNVDAGRGSLAIGKSQIDVKGANGAPGELSELFVPAKLDYKVVLSDGSTVHLNSKSKLQFPLSFSGGSREVYLEGEAYFNISKSPNAPFIVRTTSGVIKVLGTEFNVNTYKPGIARTDLVNGSVKVVNKTDSVLLRPGFSTSAEASGPLSVQPFDAESSLSWIGGKFLFQNRPLQEVVEMIPRWYNIEVIIDDQELAETVFTGQLVKTNNIDVFLQALKNTMQLKYYYKGNVLHFTKALS